MAITYTDNGTNTPNGSQKVFTYTFPTLQTEDIKVALNGIVQATTKYTASLSPAQIEFNSTSIDSSVQESTGAPKTGVQVRVYRETTVGKNSGDEDPKAFFTAGSSIRAADLNDNFEQLLFGVHELQDQPVKTSDIEPDAVTNSKIVDNAIDSEHYVDGSIDRVHLAADIVDGTKIADDSIDSEHYVDGSIDEQHLSNSAITVNKIAANAVTTTEILNGAVTRAKLEADIIDGTKLADNAVDSEHYTDGSIDRVHLEADIIDSTKLADNAVDSEHYVDGSIDRVHLEADIIDSTKLADDAVRNEHLRHDSVRTAEIQNDAVTIDKIADAAIVTNSEQASHNVDDSTFFTTAAAEARYFNASTGETIKNGDTFPDNDTTIATTAAINDRIIDLVDDVGGFVPIANETSFPTSNPDVNDGAGTIVSVSAASTNLVPSGTTVTIANGRGSGLAVIITGVSATIPSGFGFLVETTTTDHTYAFHRLSPKATEVTTVASKATEVTTVHTNITNINAVANNATNINAVAADATDIGAVAGKATEIGRLGTADAVADMAILGTADVVSDLNTLGTADVVADMNMLATSDVVADMNMLAVSDVISDMNDLATSGNITAMSTCSTNIASINNCSTNISSANTFGDQYQVASNNPSTDGGGNALAVGDLYFNTSANELKVYNGSSWQGGVTATGSFATTTGNTFTGDNRYNDNVKILLGTNNDSDFFHDGTNLVLREVDNGQILIRSDGLKVFANANGSSNQAIFRANNSVELFYDHSKKFETTSTGTKVTGDFLTEHSGGIIQTLQATTGAQSYLKFINSETGSGAFTDGLLVGLDTDESATFWLYENDHMKFATNGVERLRIDSGGDIRVTGDKGIFLGANNDLMVAHDGTSTRIEDSYGYMNIKSNILELRSKTDSEHYATFTRNGAAEIYYDHSKKFETTSYGVLSNEALKVNGNYLELNNSGDVQLTLNKGSTQLFSIRNNSNAGVHINTQNSAILALGVSTGSNNGTVESDLRILAGGLIQIPHDNKKLQIGAGQDLQLLHTGTYSNIYNATGDLDISSDVTRLKNGNRSETFASFINNGQAELYYDNSRKFYTNSTGTLTTGQSKVDVDTSLNGNTDYNGQNFGFLVSYDGGHNNNDEGNGICFAQQYADPSIDAATVRTGAIIGYKTAATGGFGGGLKFKVQQNGATSLKTLLQMDSGSSVLMPNDNSKLKIGLHQDLQLYHDGNNSFIENVGTGNLNLYADDLNILNKDRTEFKSKFITNGAVELYYDNTKKFETTSDGILISGHSQSTKLKVNSVNADLDLTSGQNSYTRYGSINHYHNNSTSEPHNQIKLTPRNGSNGRIYLKNMVGGTLATKLLIDAVDGIVNYDHCIPATDSTYNLGSNSARFANAYVDTYYGDGSNLTGISSVGGSTGVDFNDNVKARFGTGNDLEIYHDQSHSWIRNSTGNLYINPKGAEVGIALVPDGKVELRYDDVAKLETMAEGVKVTGNGNYSQVIMRNGSGNNQGKVQGWRSGSGNDTEVGFAEFDTANWFIRCDKNASSGAKAEYHWQDVRPASNNSFDLGSSSNRWRNIYTNDLNLSNEGSSNDVDGSWGNWTIQEGESDLFLKNNRSGKKYKFNLTEVS